MYSRDPYVQRPVLGGFEPPPRDVWILLGIVFATFSLNHLLQPQGLLTQWLGLTPLVFRWGLLWQLVTYPFVGVGAPNLWFLVELFILYSFAGNVYRSLGRKPFWQLLVTSAFGAAVVAVLVEVLLTLWLGATPEAFVLMQGQRMLMVILITAFASLFGNATIYLFFVLPIRARWFLYLPILFAFLGFLNVRDFAGFVGVCAAVALTWGFFQNGGLLRVGRNTWLRLRQRRYEAELRRLRKNRGLHVVPGDDDRSGGSGGVRKGPWVH